MWQKHLQDAWHTGKRTVGNMWNHAVKIVGDLDSGVRFTKRLFGALHPMIEDMGGSNVSRGVVQALGHYERGRDEVIGHHNNVQAQLSRIRRAVPELDLD